MGSRFNPFTGNIDYVSNPGQFTTAREVDITLDCDAGAAPGDSVIISATVDDLAVVVTSNNYVGVVMGVIISKPSTTTCSVRVLGRIDGLASGLGKGKPIFIGASGELTTTPPITGGQQVMGIAITATDFLVNPERRKVILT